MGICTLQLHASYIEAKKRTAASGWDVQNVEPLVVTTYDRAHMAELWYTRVQ